MPDPLPGGALRSRHVLLVILLAGALVIARSAVFWYYDQAFFDSDQAIVGLMAKHLAEGRAFPLFYYGQTYMLVVDAWFTAPIFLVTGATVRALHGSLILMNLLVVAGLAWTFVRELRLGVMAAVGALIFFAFAPPMTSASLIEAGANIAPFIAVVLLWWFRDRPLPFGVVLGIGLHNREFLIYAVAALVLGDLVQGRLFQRKTMHTWLFAMVVTMAAWQAMDVLKAHSDMMGPQTRGLLVAGDGGSQIGNVRDRMALEPAEWPARTHAMLVEHLPGLWGLRPYHDAIADQGHRWLFWPFMLCLALALARVAVLRRRMPTPGPDGFAWYLTAVGALAVAAYVATRPAEGVVHRYLLLSLLFPTGVTALFFIHERARLARVLLWAVLLAWAGGSAQDHWRQVVRYTSGSEPDEMRVLADGLLARHITVAEGGYWIAYKLSFLTQERVKVASTDVARIEEYQQLARTAGPALVTISTTPCDGGEKVSLWYLCGPAGLSPPATR